jgi:site-specific DNA-cytosine methylase
MMTAAVARADAAIITPDHPEFLRHLPEGSFAIWNGHARDWNEARVIADPVKKVIEPRLLVQRKQAGLLSERGENLVFFPGPTAISLFTGAGGMDLGMEAAGFCTLVQHEWSECACETLIANRPRHFRNSALIQGDIRRTPTSMLLREAGLRVGEVDIVSAGPPCQGFTTANKHASKGTYDERNDLVLEFLRVVREAQQKHFIMENVPGFLRFTGKLNGRSYLEVFLARAHEAYYELVYGLLDACEYGVPQHRCRFICMGTRRDLVEIDGILGSLPAPICFADRDLGTIQQLDGGLFQQEVDLLRHAPGIRYFPDRPVLIPPESTHGGQRSASFMEFYRRLREKEPDRIIEAPKAQGARG